MNNLIYLICQPIIFDEARTIEQEFLDAVNKNIKTNVRLYKESLPPLLSLVGKTQSPALFMHASSLFSVNGKPARLVVRSNNNEFNCNLTYKFQIKIIEIL